MVGKSSPNPTQQLSWKQAKKTRVSEKRAQFLARFFLLAYSLENANSLVTESPDWRTSSKLCTAPAVWKPNPWPNPGIGWEQPQVLKGFHGHITRRRCRVFWLQLVNVLVRVQLVTHVLQLLHKWTSTKYPKAMGEGRETELRNHYDQQFPETYANPIAIIEQEKRWRHSEA